MDWALSRNPSDDPAKAGDSLACVAPERKPAALLEPAYGHTQVSRVLLLLCLTDLHGVDHWRTSFYVLPSTFTATTCASPDIDGIS
jgi:hypothetical protein